MLNLGVSDGIRTRGHQNHNLALYQLSYTHRLARPCAQPTVRQEGIEPPAHSLEGCCSIRLSYWRKHRQNNWMNGLLDCWIAKTMELRAIHRTTNNPLIHQSNNASLRGSGQQELNLRPPAPKAGALAGLRHAPNPISTRLIKINHSGDKNQAEFQAVKTAVSSVRPSPKRRCAPVSYRPHSRPRHRRCQKCR